MWLFTADHGLPEAPALGSRESLIAVLIEMQAGMRRPTRDQVGEGIARRLENVK